MKDLKIKIVTGFRDDQCYSIGIEDAHKAYRLFSNPEERAIFSNGLAVIGTAIKSIEPDFHGTMGWNKGYILTADDYAEISAKGIDRKIRDMMSAAKEIAMQRPDLIKLPLSQALEKAGLHLSSNLALPQRI